jgi:hypothetical protein
MLVLDEQLLGRNLEVALARRILEGRRPSKPPKGADCVSPVIDTFRALPLTQTPMAALLDSAYRLAVKHARTVYDML